MSRIVQAILLSFIAISNSYSQLVFIGDGSRTSENCAEITPDANNQKGWVYNPSKVDLSVDQDFSYNINLGSNDANGADGMVFMLHNDPRGIGAQGCVGEAMGYGSHPSGLFSEQCGFGQWSAIQPSIAVEFDTWQNRNQGDPAADHVALIENGSVNHGNSYVSISNIEDGLEHEFIFNWNASTNQLSVSLDGITLISQTRDIVNEIFGGENMVY